jgi:hypothetical protein
MIARRISMVFAAVCAAGLMVSALWAWQQGPHLSIDADRPEVVLWAVRTAAVAAGALAQALLLFLVIGQLYRARGLDVLLRVLTAAVFTVALVSAVALALAGR